MKAAILTAPGDPLAIEEVDLSACLPDEVRVRIAASGLCHSDFARITGARPCPLPAVLGHEASGIVEAVGADVSHVRPGDAVILGASSCGTCGQCGTGHSHLCDRRPQRSGAPRIAWRGQPVFQFVDIGAFAEAALVHRSAVVKLPEGIPLDLAALLPCAVISGVGAVLHCAQVRPGESVAVVGCGGVGLNVIQGARIAGAAQIIAIDVNPAKLEMARQFGATDVLLADPDIAAQVIECSRGGVDHAFEVVGSATTVRDALLMLRKRGKLLLVGIPPAGAEAHLPMDAIFAKELRILSTVSGSAPLGETVAMLAQNYREGRLLLEPLVSQRIALEDINTGYARLHEGGIARSLIVF